MSVTPEQYNRRSFIHARLAAAGAEFVDIGDAAVADRFPGRPVPSLGLADLSPLPRTGIKGPRAFAWLVEAGWPVPTANNTVAMQEAGHIVARLGDREAIVLVRFDADHDRVRQLADAIPGGGAWVVPRRDTNCWFRLRGDRAVDCLQKLCGVDLRAAHFPAGSVAQTSVARLNAIVIRDPAAEGHEFHLLADSASAGWFWNAVLDAMDEFGGGPAGLNE